MSVAILIPCKDESENIQVLLHELALASRQFTLDFKLEIWLCGASAPDAQYPWVVHSHPELAAVSVQEAIYAAANASSSDWLLVMDADLQHPPAAAFRFLQSLDILCPQLWIGTRRSLVALSPPRRIASTLLNRLFRFRTGLSITDPLSGFFAVPKAWLTQLSVDPTFKPLLALAKAHPKQISEFSYDFYARRGGSSKLDWRRSWQTLRDIWR